MFVSWHWIPLEMRAGSVGRQIWASLKFDLLSLSRFRSLWCCRLVICRDIWLCASATSPREWEGAAASALKAAAAGWFSHSIHQHQLPGYKEQISASSALARAQSNFYNSPDYSCTPRRTGRPLKINLTPAGAAALIAVNYYLAANLFPLRWKIPVVSVRTVVERDFTPLFLL